MIRTGYLKSSVILYNFLGFKLPTSFAISFNMTAELKRSFKVQHNRSFQSLCKSPHSSVRADTFEKYSLKVQLTGFYSHRYIWGWLNSIFNRVDEQRILDAGPDRACAEWLLRCGAGVKWFNSDRWIRDYNSLPIASARMFKIEEVDGTDSAVMHIGFPHFKGCKHIRRVVLHRATYIDDEALRQLHYLRESLRELQISSCGNISRDGLNRLKKLCKLEYLLLYDLPLIKNKDEVIKDLGKALPSCTLVFPYAQASERPQDEEAT